MSTPCDHQHSIGGSGLIGPIGQDVDSEGSTDQFIDQCPTCQAWRYASEHTSWQGQVRWFYGRWHEASEPMPSRELFS